METFIPEDKQRKNLLMAGLLSLFCALWGVILGYVGYLWLALSQDFAPGTYEKMAHFERFVLDSVRIGMSFFGLGMLSTAAMFVIGAILLFFGKRNFTVFVGGRVTFLCCFILMAEAVMLAAISESIMAKALTILTFFMLTGLIVAPSLFLFRLLTRSKS